MNDVGWGWCGGGGGGGESVERCRMAARAAARGRGSRARCIVNCLFLVWGVRCGCGYQIEYPGNFTPIFCILCLGRKWIFYACKLRIFF